MFDLNGTSLQDTAISQQAMAPIQTPGIQTPQPGAAMAPIAGAQTPAGATGPGFFQEGGGLQIGLGAIQTLGSLWNSFQQQKMAKKTFNLQKDAYETNLANQRSTYNSALEDRIRSRGAYSGASREEQDATIAERSL